MTPLPPNPYTLGPIKSRDRLAARSGELKDIEYYLRLAEAGQSPHLALIGQRGVGKTSLLLAVSSLARARHLLPVAIDLTESKVRSAGVFWHDFYSTLILAAARAGCWGGATGPIYSSLLEQLYHRKVIDLELAVLQFPLVIARHDGDLPSLPCPDSLIVHDFGAVRDELQANGLQGIALLLDEGDCLGAHRSLLQTLRNVLQRVRGESAVDVISAGTLSRCLTRCLTYFPQSPDNFIGWTSHASLSGLRRSSSCGGQPQRQSSRQLPPSWNFMTSVKANPQSYSSTATICTRLLKRSGRSRWS